MTVATFLPTERVSSYVLLAVRRKLICWYSCGVTEIHLVLVVRGRLRFTQLQSHPFFFPCLFIGLIQKRMDLIQMKRPSLCPHMRYTSFCLCHLTRRGHL